MSNNGTTSDEPLDEERQGDNPYASPRAVGEPAADQPVEEVLVEPINPWLGIWFWPRHTMRFLLQEPRYRLPQLLLVYFAAAAIGYGGSLLAYSSGSLSDTVADAIGVLIALLIFGLIGWGIKTLLLHFSAHRLRGQGDFYPTMAAVAWSQVPVMLSFLLMLPTNACEALLQKAAGVEWFDSTLVNGLLTQIAYLWSLVTLSHCLGVVHAFSSWKGAGTILIAMIIVASLCIAFFMTCIAMLGGFGPYN